MIERASESLHLDNPRLKVASQPTSPVLYTRSFWSLASMGWNPGGIQSVKGEDGLWAGRALSSNVKLADWIGQTV